MPVQIRNLARVFRFSGADIADPAPSFSAEDCLPLLAQTNPQLLNAVVEGPFSEGTKQVYKLKTSIGNKG
jgi:PRTRC genetic system protein C